MVAVAALGLAANVQADVSLPHIFSDHMVLQQQKPIPVWGKADPGESVTVTFAGHKATAVADDKGAWVVRLPPLRAANNQAGQTLTVKGKNTVTFQDVLLGEVWVCSGQSNMQWAVGGSNNGPQEIAAAKYPQIRLFTVPNITAANPQDDCDGAWTVCTPETVGGFSAVGYFFGRHLHEQLKVPVGLINSSWGGTIAEAWTSAPALRAKLPEFNAALDALGKPDDAATKAFATYQEKLAERQKALETLYAKEDDLAAAGTFAAGTFDDSTWKSMALPGNWEVKELPNVDGIVWFRKSVTIPEAWAGKDIILRPGPIDEVDDCWFNGTFIDGKGRSRTNDTSFWNVPREYRVPGAQVKAGANVIAIRVIDCLGQGGPWGAAADTMFIELADGSDKTRLPLAGDWLYFAELVLPNVPPNPNTPNYPSVLFNAMINPLVPYGIQGAIWYQGESNVGRAKQYKTLLPTMISDWRTRWGEGDFTFLIVQLANFMARNTAPEDSGWAELREAQTFTTTALPQVGMATIIDIGDEKDIHPRNKQDVGLRLGLAARAIAYREPITYSGPLFHTMAVKDGKATLTFAHVGAGLKVKGDTLKGFAVCGTDKKYVWAQAKVEGETVVVWAEAVPQPVAVRYNWANNPEGNLYNAADLPAVPFRTDGE